METQPESVPSAVAPLPPLEPRFLALRLVYEWLDGPVTDANPGSIWHGAWGAAVDSVACAVRQDTCHGCWMLQHCAAVSLASVKQGTAGVVEGAGPHGFVLRGISGWGLETDGTLEVEVTLLSPATQYLALFLVAAERLGAMGLGKARRRLRLLRVVESDLVALPRSVREESGALQSGPLRTWDDLKPLSLKGWVRLALPAGAILVAGNQTLIQPTLLDIIRLLRRRVRLVCQERNLDAALVPEADMLAWLSQTETRVRVFEPFHASRWSSRQRQRHPQTGVQGYLEVEGASLAPIEPWLRLGQVLGLGKGTSMGLGRLEVTPLA